MGKDTLKETAAQTVLIADPKGVLCEELKAFLDNSGLRSTGATSMKETLLTLQRSAVDVIILDSSMLGEDCSLIPIIKGIQQSLPIIVCADINSPELERCARQKGIFFYHIKSFGNQDLEMAIQSALQKSSQY
jgi:DNA-binding NtrC family response regulator